MRSSTLFTSVAGAALALVVSFLVACGNGGTQAPTPGSISGTVTSEGDPVEGVQVSLTGAATAQATTDASGAFTFTDLEPGDYQVTISGWPADVTISGAVQNVTLESGATRSIQFSGSYVRTASVGGVVQVDGAAKAGVTVALSGVEDRQTETDAAGAFSFGNLRAGSYTVTVSGAGGDVVLDQDQKTVDLSVGEHASLAFSGQTVVAATLEVPYVEKPNSSLRLNLDDIQGPVDVVVLVDPGSQTVDRVRLYLRGEQVGEQVFSGGLTSKQKLEFRVETEAFDPDTGDPLYANGSAVLRADGDTESGGAAAISDQLDITLTNQDRIAGVQALNDADGVVNEGHRWFGNQDLQFQVYPVLYDQSRTIGAISLQAVGDPSANGGPSLDLGSGPGQPHKVQGPPFVFTATKADNEGLVEDSPTGSGHTLKVAKVFDGDGVDITSDFLPGRTTPLTHFYVDFVPPQIPAGSGIAVAGTPVASGDWLSAGAFSVTSMTETGSGGVTTTYEVSDATTTTPITGVDAIAGLPEGRNDRFRIGLVSVEDVVGNQTDAATFPPDSPPFGVDRTPVAVTNIRPTNAIVLNPLDAALDGITDNRLTFAASDPNLPGGTAASGYGMSNAEAVAADGTTLNISPSIAPDATGTNTIDMNAMGETTWTITVTTKDQAKPANQTVFSYDLTIDKSPPTVTIIDAPPSALAVSGDQTVQVEGSASDPNGLSKVLLTVREEIAADDGTTDTAPGACDPGDPLVTNTAAGATGNAPAASFDVTQQNATNPSFVQQVTLTKPASSFTQHICFFIEARDNAKDVNGNPEANVTDQFSRTDFTWN